VLIARAVDKSLGAFLQERIFSPLGMKDTAFSVPEAKLDRLATCYWADMKTGECAVFDEARGGNIQILPLLEPAARGSPRPSTIIWRLAA
jgi:CubicO group peptidase (beta-lactamase class C family)